MAFLHFLSGEAARTGRDYQRHYRSAYPHLIDPNRRVEKQLNKNGWPFYVVVDGKGAVVFMKNGAASDLPGLDEVLTQVAPGKPAKRGEYGGTTYLETTLERNKAAKRVTESAPCLVNDRSGAQFLSFVSDGRGKSEVFLRHLGGGPVKLDHEICISEGYADAHDAVVAVDRANNKWIAYTGLPEDSEESKYDIFVRCFDNDGELFSAVNLTESDDDAMHPAAVVDEQGHLWVAYYRWMKMGMASRDKEIFARCWNGARWSDEIRLSPDDLPAYEDHTDPAIAAAPGGGVNVAWSWDMHSSKIEKYARLQKEYHADAPTIFGRAVNRDGAEDLLFLGEAGIDGAPALFLASGGKTWCAWNGLGNLRRGETKGLYTSVCSADANIRSGQFPVEVKVRDICTPRFFERKGSLGLVWASQDNRDVWVLKMSTFADGDWTKPAVIEKKHNPRFPTVIVDDDGAINIAFVRDGSTGREVALRTL